MLLKVYKFKFLLALLLVPFMVNADPPGWDKTETLFTHVITVPAGVTPTIDGVAIETGDWIGVFFNDGGTLVCGGSIEYTAGVSNSFSAYGDDPLTVGVKDGFANGESFNWKIYDSSADEEYWAEAEYSSGGNSFTINGFSTVSSLTAPAFAVTATADPEVLCTAGDVTLQGELLAGGPVQSWEWFVEGSSIGTGQTLVVSVSETTTFTLEAYDGLLTATSSVTVVGPPSVTAGDDMAICSSDAAAGVVLSGAAAANYIALSWATSGDGTFSNPNALNPTYFPGAGDLANGMATLTLTAISTNCGPVDATMDLTIQPAPTINILPEQDYVCYGDTYDFAGMVEAANYEDIQWFTTNGDGFFTPNETVLEPVYNPSPTVDYPQLCIIIGVAAGPIDPCTVAAEDYMNLCFVAPPEVYAGEDMAFCNDAVTEITFADASVTFDPNWGGEIMWTSTGDGSFDDSTAMNPTYTFGPNDLATTGDITFTLTAETPEACGPVSDQVVVSMQLPPTIDIIPDSYTICEDEVMDFAGLVEGANYGSLQWFTTNGDGFFTPNETVLEPVYNPSPSVDYPQGCIIIGVAAAPIDPCTVADEDFMDLCFQMLPVVVAGEDATICANETYTTNPTVENTTGPYMWTHNGNGYFEDPTQLDATYVADAADGNTVVTLTLTAEPISPCTIATSGSMDLTVLPAPYVNAGEDFTVCETDNPMLCGEAEYVSETMWATTGDGYFCCPDQLCEVTYYPGPMDIENGCVTLVLIGYPLEPCSLYELDKVVVCFDPAPMVNAGPDMTICEDGTAQLDGTTEDVCGIQWVTFDGTGMFDDETAEDPVYTPSFQDVISGTVHLIMIGAPCGACTEPAMDTMALTIQRGPVVDAGEDMTVCEDASITLDGATADYYSALSWTGNVDDPTALNPVYTPTADDIANGSAELCLTAAPIDPCTVEATDCVTIWIQLNPAIDILPDSATICYEDTFDFTDLVVASDYTAIQWFTTNGDGIFSPNEEVLEPVYQPSPSVDYPQGCIEIGVVVSPINPCTVSSEDFMTLCFQPPIELELPQSAIICEDGTFTPEPYLLENACGVMWTTNGDGTFDDPTLEYPVYTPGMEDIANGGVVLNLEATGCATCANVSAEIYVEIYYLPEANAGEDDVVCEYICAPPCPPYQNGQYTLDMATVTNACGQSWTTSGDGTFDDDMALNPTYTLGAGDIANGSVELCLIAAPCNPCTVADTDCMTLTIQPFPEANAGPDQTICEGVSAQLDGSTVNAMGVFWDFALLGEGDGSWNNQLIEDPIYTPGPGDIDRGYVELVMVAFPMSPCTYPDADVMTVFITQEPVAFAGEDGTICAGETYPLSDAYVENATGGVNWTTTGDGTFDPGADVVNPTYIPGPNDTIAGTVDLCLQALDGPECSGTYSDCMTLTILPPPVVFAGDDAVTCCDVPYEILDATAGNVSSVMWTTTGDGSFDDVNLLNATYTPGAEDCGNGSVELCIEGMPIDPCTLSATDCMILNINPLPDANICFNGEVAGYGDTFEYCYNENVEVTLCEILEGTGPFDICYTVNGGDEECVTVDEGEVIFSDMLAPGTYNIQLTSMMDANGCVNPNIELYGATVIVNPEPVAGFCVNGDLAATGSEFEFCYDTEVDVTLCDIVEGTGPFTVCYTVNNGPEECATVAEGESLFTGMLDPGEYLVQVTSIVDANGCAVADVTPYWLTVTIYPEPDANICFNGEVAGYGDIFEYCYDENVEVTLCEILSGTGPFEVCYTVNGGDPICTTVDEGEVIFSDMLEPGTYEIQITSMIDAHGCALADPTPYAATVIVHDEPFIVFAFNGVQVAPGFEETYCEDTPVVVTLDEIWAGCAPFEVCYSINGDAPVCVSIENPGDELFNQMMDPGVYTVEVVSLTDACGCAASQATLDLYTATITIQANPTVAAMDDVTACASEQMPYCIDATAANYSSLEWTTSGTGSFNDPAIEDPCYSPSQEDFDNGSVELCLYAAPVDPCTVGAEECFTLTLQQGPTAYAGEDDVICEDGCYELAGATATYYDGLLWTTVSGDGTFSDETVLNPTYCPGPMDIVNGSVELCLIAAPIDPCTLPAEDCMTLTINKLPTVIVNDGMDITVCDNILGTNMPYVELCGVATDYDYVSWSTADGSGFFDPEFDLCTAYYPSEADVIAGEVTLCLTAYPLAPCENEVTECITLYFDPSPEAFAGNNDTICEGDTYNFADADPLAFVANASNWYWTTDGDGTFDDATLLHPIYTPGVNDIANSGVNLCLVAEPEGGCNVDAVDCMFLSIVPNPVIDLEPVIELTCENYNTDLDAWDPVPVCADVMFAESVMWTTDGDGYFDDPTAACTNYNIGPNDKWATEVPLHITAEGPGACMASVTADVTLMIPSQLIYIVEPAPAWQGISSYVNKSDTEVPEVMYPVVGDPPGSQNLIIMIDKGGDYYWPIPSPPQNKLGNWDKVGYKAKFQTAGCLPIYGDTLDDQSFFIDGAFTYLPVLTNVVVPLEDAGNRIFFTPDEWNDILFILDWTTGKLINGFGPIGAGALTELVPGRGYLLVKNDRNNEFTVEFPNFDPAAGIYATYYNQPDKGMDIASPWNDVTNTGNPHALFFMDQVLSQFKPGDVIGAFDAYGTCVGVTEYNAGDNMFALLAMGDDPMTDAVDGYEAGENMSFKLYRAETGETFDVTFTYDAEFPNYDNTFQVYGVSKVVDVTMNATSIGGEIADKNINVYPNPANDVINIASDYNMKRVTLVNYVGQTVFTKDVTGNDFQINVSSYVTGMYFVRIETASGSVVTKRITIE